VISIIDSDALPDVELAGLGIVSAIEQQPPGGIGHREAACNPLIAGGQAGG
jgi:hypothetical protein